MTKSEAEVAEVRAQLEALLRDKVAAPEAAAADNNTLEQALITVQAERDQVVREKDALALENQAIREHNQRLEGQLAADRVYTTPTHRIPQFYYTVLHSVHTVLYADQGRHTTASTATYTYLIT